MKGGRCEECQGDGIKRIEMQFLPDVYVTCSACGGRRFNKETLSVLYKHRSIADVLDMTVDEAVDFFEPVTSIHRKLKTLSEVGLGYIKLGQQATTLSGGEAQRVKLSTELAKTPRGHTLYILDEPTTGLHIADIKQLLEVLVRLRDLGNTVLVIEHNLDVVKVADHIIDMGPEGGDAGGQVVATGTPETIAKCKASYTGQWLAKTLSPNKQRGLYEMRKTPIVLTLAAVFATGALVAGPLGILGRDKDKDSSQQNAQPPKSKFQSFQYDKDAEWHRLKKIDVKAADSSQVSTSFAWTSLPRDEEAAGERSFALAAFMTESFMNAIKSGQAPPGRSPTPRRRDRGPESLHNSDKPAPGARLDGPAKHSVLRLRGRQEDRKTIMSFSEPSPTPSRRTAHGTAARRTS
jgi:ABC-type multidrug transport system ATPase subunit